MACRSTTKTAKWAMDSLFIALGRGRILQNFTTGTWFIFSPIFSRWELMRWNRFFSLQLSQLWYARHLISLEMNYRCTLPSSFQSLGRSFPSSPHPPRNKLRSWSFVVGLAITFRMQSSYSRWWDGRIQWDKLSAESRSFARTIWLHVPLSTGEIPGSELPNKREVIKCIHTFAVALKHHLRGEREWCECRELRRLLSHLPNVNFSLFEPSIVYNTCRNSNRHWHKRKYNYTATNHPLTITLHLSSFVETYRVRIPASIPPNSFPNHTT